VPGQQPSPRGVAAAEDRGRRSALVAGDRRAASAYALTDALPGRSPGLKRFEVADPWTTSWSELLLPGATMVL